MEFQLGKQAQGQFNVIFKHPNKDKVGKARAEISPTLHVYDKSLLLLLLLSRVYTHVGTVCRY